MPRPMISPAVVAQRRTSSTQTDRPSGVTKLQSAILQTPHTDNMRFRVQLTKITVSAAWGVSSMTSRSTNDQAAITCDFRNLCFASIKVWTKLDDAKCLLRIIGVDWRTSGYQAKRTSNTAEHSCIGFGSLAGVGGSQAGGGCLRTHPTETRAFKKISVMQKGFWVNIHDRAGDHLSPTRHELLLILRCPTHDCFLQPRTLAQIRTVRLLAMPMASLFGDRFGST